MGFVVFLDCSPGQSSRLHTATAVPSYTMLQGRFSKGFRTFAPLLFLPSIVASKYSSRYAHHSCTVEAILRCSLDFSPAVSLMRGLLALCPHGSLLPLVLFVSQWVIVSWIDSKAMFGDEHTYVQEHQSQLLSYVNRCTSSRYFRCAFALLRPRLWLLTGHHLPAACGRFSLKYFTLSHIGAGYCYCRVVRSLLSKRTFVRARRACFGVAWAATLVLFIAGSLKSYETFCFHRRLC